MLLDPRLDDAFDFPADLAAAVASTGETDRSCRIVGHPESGDDLDEAFATLVFDVGDHILDHHLLGRV